MTTPDPLPTPDALDSTPPRRWSPYPAYKDSGVPWLGEVPEHWEVQRLRTVCQMNPSKSEIGHLPGDTDISFLPMERIGEDGTLSLKEIRPIEQVKQGFTYFRDGDVIVAKITPCFENGKGVLCTGLLNGIGFGTTELHVLRPRDGTCPAFIAYIARTVVNVKRKVALPHFVWRTPERLPWGKHHRP